MLISCPNCNTNFAVPARAIGAMGKKVKCSKCGHNWFQEPVKLEKSQMDNLLNAENLGSDRNLPARVNKKLSSLHIAASVIIVALIIFAEVMKNPASYDAIASKLKLNDNSAVKFVNFKSESKFNDNKLDFALSGQIVNTTDKRVKIPDMDIKVMSKGGRVITQAKLQPEKDSLEPYEVFAYNPKITRVTGNANKIVLSYGNWLENIFKE